MNEWTTFTKCRQLLLYTCRQIDNDDGLKFFFFFLESKREREKTGREMVIVTGSVIWSRIGTHCATKNVWSRGSACVPKRSMAYRDIRSVHSSKTGRSSSIFTTSLLNRPTRSRRKSNTRRQKSAAQTHEAPLHSAAEGYHGYLSDGDLQLKRFDYNYWIRDIALTNIGAPGFTLMAYAR